jgi:hypothetical protein
MGGMSYKPQGERERSKTARKTLNDQDPLPVLYMAFDLVQGFNRMGSFPSCISARSGTKAELNEFSG